MRNNSPRRQGRGVAIFVCISIDFGIVDTCSSIDNDNKAITIILKDSQYPTSISTIYVLPVCSIKYRSSRPDVFLGKGVLKICSKLTGERRCRSETSIKLLCNFI